jgi:RNA polymerase sigma factor (sigma-70 family)
MTPMSCNRVSDAQLYHAWRAGDRRAGGELSRRYMPLLLRFIRHRISDPTAAKDVVGCALLQLVKSRDSVKDPAQFRAFVMGIAWNTIKTHYRSHVHDRLQFVGDEHLDVVQPHPHHEPDVEHSNPDPAVEMLVHALERLPLDDQQLIMASYADGMSYLQLAVALELEVGTVASRLSAAKARLVEVMQELDRARDPAPSMASDFTQWAHQVRQRLERPSLGRVLPRKIRRWRLIDFEPTGIDSIRSAYRRWSFQTKIELEIRGEMSERGGEREHVVLRDRDWRVWVDRASRECVMQTRLRDGRILRLTQRPANDGEQVLRFATELDIERIEQYVPDDSDSLALGVESSSFGREAWA